jgi:hypothetical protein
MYKDLVFTLKFFLIFATFLGGFIVAYGKVFPYQLIAPFVASYGQYFAAMDIEAQNNDWRWYAEEGLPKGMTLNLTEKAQQEYIAYSSTVDTTLRLLNESGEAAFSWRLDVEALWPEQDHINTIKKVPFDYFTLRDFHIFPDGRALVIVSMYGSTPWGAGLVMLDKKSNVLWAQQGYYYNDLHVDKAGNIYALRHEIINESDEGKFDEAVAFNTPYLQDLIVKLNQQGEIIEEFAVVDILRKSLYKNLAPHLEDDGTGDYTHTNAIDVIEAGVDTPDFLNAGDIMATIRNLDVLVAIDAQTKQIKWASRLPVKMPHDIDVLPSGNFMLYDNQGYLGPEGYSRLVELDPETLGVEWSYVGERLLPFESEFWGFQQRLDNGNTLTAVPNKGYLFEVTPAGEVVMAYYVPYRKVEDGVSYNPVLTSAEKIKRSDLLFLDNHEQE